ncbi:uncharacterized protein L203_101847 [Cryptococcus depauperatus CBS 7841]|uniref:Uncharacterized protein n=1 Tax=Cryptococcus depauperatus CBS 7841 TaxID=1295531 RepID=A0A1E3IIW8_9TREE|nr:ribosomal RNA-processing protein 17 [Cryptococcus depauperatus CBS 7841]
MTKSVKSNVALLTEGAVYIQRAKKARREQVEEIKFDDEARRDWLTGFSKRKKVKTEERKTRAIERERQEHLEERRQARKDMRERAAENVKSVRIAMGLAPEDEESEAGPSKAKENKQEQEFSDEEQIATVTITEDFDPSAPTFYSRSTSLSPNAANNLGEGVDEKKVEAKLGSSLLPPSSKRAQKKNSKKKEKETKSMETKAERRRGKELEARKRDKKTSLALEKHGKSRGKIKGREAKGKFKSKTRR